MFWIIIRFCKIVSAFEVRILHLMCTLQSLRCALYISRSCTSQSVQMVVGAFEVCMMHCALCITKCANTHYKMVGGAFEVGTVHCAFCNLCKTKCAKWVGGRIKCLHCTQCTCTVCKMVGGAF